MRQAVRRRLLASVIFAAACSASAPSAGLEASEPLQCIWSAQLAEGKACSVAGRLPNGLQYVVIYNPRPSDKSVVGLYVDAGNLDEQPHQRGATHVLEHILLYSFNDEAGRPISLGDLSERYGVGSVNGSATTRTFFDAALPSSEWRQGLFLISQIAKLEPIDPRILRQQANLVAAEEMQGGDDSAAFAAQAAGSSTYFTHAATVQHVLGLTPAAIEEFRRTWYRPDRMILVIQAPEQPAKIIEAIKSVLNVPAATAPPPVRQIQSVSTGPFGAITNSAAFVSTLTLRFLHPAHRDNTFGHVAAQTLVDRFRIDNADNPGFVGALTPSPRISFAETEFRAPAGVEFTVPVLPGCELPALDWLVDSAARNIASGYDDPKAPSAQLAGTLTSVPHYRLFAEQAARGNAGYPSPVDPVLSPADIAAYTGQLLRPDNASLIYVAAPGAQDAGIVRRRFAELIGGFDGATVQRRVANRKVGTCRWPEAAGENAQVPRLQPNGSLAKKLTNAAPPRQLIVQFAPNRDQQRTVITLYSPTATSSFAQANIAARLSFDGIFSRTLAATGSAAKNDLWFHSYTGVPGIAIAAPEGADENVASTIFAVLGQNRIDGSSVRDGNVGATFFLEGAERYYSEALQLIERSYLSGGKLPGDIADPFQQHGATIDVASRTWGEITDSKRPLVVEVAGPQNLSELQSYWERVKSELPKNWRIIAAAKAQRKLAPLPALTRRDYYAAELGNAKVRIALRIPISTAGDEAAIKLYGEELRRRIYARLREQEFGVYTPLAGVTLSPEHDFATVSVPFTCHPARVDELIAAAEEEIDRVDPSLTGPSSRRGVARLIITVRPKPTR